jgi:hypothetical protein
MLGIPYLTKKVAITAVALVAAGGATAAAVIPAVAAPSSTSAPSTAPATPHHGTKAPGKHHGHPIVRALVHATAKATGLPVTTVLKDLAAGQTLNQIAGGKAAAVENDALTALQKRLDRAVDRHKITKQQEADLLAKAKTRIEKLMGEDLSKALHGASPTPSTSAGASTGTAL